MRMTSHMGCGWAGGRALRGLVAVGLATLLAAGGVARGAPPAPGTGSGAATVPADAATAAPRVVAAVSGTIAGGGALGPGGAVVWLKRVGGETPRPSPAKGKVVSQRNKSFVPRVLAVPVGTKV